MARGRPPPAHTSLVFSCHYLCITQSYSRMLANKTAANTRTPHCSVALTSCNLKRQTEGGNNRRQQASPLGRLVLTVGEIALDQTPPPGKKQDLQLLPRMYNLWLNRSSVRAILFSFLCFCFVSSLEIHLLN